MSNLGLSICVSKLIGHVKEIITMDTYGDNKNIIADGVPGIEAYMQEVLHSFCGRHEPSRNACISIWGRLRIMRNVQRCFS